VARLSNSVVAAFALAALGAAPSAAEPAEPAANGLATILPHEKGRALCYVSKTAPVTYPVEASSAGKRPRTVTIKRFLFELRSEQHAEDDTLTPPKPGDFYYGYRMVADVEGKKAKLIASGECGSGDDTKVFGCSVECDGGTMVFELVEGADALSMQVSRRFRMTWGCDADELEKVEVLRYDPATPAVRMEKADAKACAPIARSFKRKK
jgi:hypothetical protein